jgi:hypothetical protein
MKWKRRAVRMQKRTAPLCYFADPSPEMIAAAEESEMSSWQSTVAKNKLERNRLRREEIEIEDFLSERTRRLQQQEEEDRRRCEEELEAETRKREDTAAAERRKKFYSDWLEYAHRRRRLQERWRTFSPA